MKSGLGLALGLSILALAPAALGQAVQAQASGTVAPGTFGANPAYQPAPAYYPAPRPIENIGRTGQFIFGMERVTGIFFDQQLITYKDQTTGASQKFTFKNTSFGLLGLDSASPSALPRFALDYVIFEGITVGGSFVLSTRGMSVGGGSPSAQPPAPPPTSNADGLTLFGNARVGYAYAFDSTFGIWPRAGLAYASSSARSELRDPSTGKSLGTYEYKANFGTVNLELLLAISPIKNIVLTAGPYVDVGIGGGYTVLRDSTEIDKRDAHLTSYGLLVNAAGYY
jgi:opacity protein-like surface antigen